MGEDRQYLAHEYFNRDWATHSFRRDGRAPGQRQADLRGLGELFRPTFLLLSLTEGQLEFLNEIPDPVFRQTVRDLMVNEQFRRDYFVKGPLRLSGLDRFEATRDERFVLTTKRDAVTLSVASAGGDRALRDDIYLPILDALADGQPRSFGEILQAFGQGDAGFGQVFEALIVMIGKGDVAAAQADAAIAAAQPNSDRTQTRLFLGSRAFRPEYRRARQPGHRYGGSWSPGFQQLFLLARAQGAVSPADWAAFAWKCLSDQAQRVVVDGAVLESPEDNLAELTKQATVFEAERLPILKATLVAVDAPRRRVSGNCPHAAVR